MKSYIAGAVAGLAVAASAGAVVVTTSQTQTFMGIPNFGGEFLFNQFNAADFGNPADITLLSAEVIATASISGGLLEVDNDGIDPANIPLAELGASIFLSSNGLPLALPGVAPVTTSMFALAGNIGDGGTFDAQDLSEPDFGQLLGGDVSDTDNSLFAGALASLFAGAGTFDVDYNALSIFNFGGVGGVSFAGTPVTVTLTVEVIYTYEVVPAPAAPGLFGLAGLVAARRRR